ncbi:MULTISPECIES: ABC transporter ATP-binding protein [unclassified Ensifer]|uniref:dipeptide ABC transporter ATP-binding protein n=1 Tax=unclassified Ensifer TaxID=2633371 RepID=UPI00088322A2|nr:MULTISPECIES: ABC transporter ATP-binding protein [unclassified Ensifer]MBD9594840.1 ABC transporter ATP-binding protein [Ensifer sp. ENS05]SDN81693.1 peptide/nickel transport system ATP-binding protein [Ensifer sp. YR511]
MDPSHIEVRDLKLVYTTGPKQEVTAVDSVSFSIAKGETLGIVGESGCGKSSLARAFLAYTRPGARFAGGSVKVSGVDVLNFGPGEILKYRGRKAAMVPQNPLSSLTPHRTIGKHLVELIELHDAAGDKSPRAKALELLAAMELPTPEAIYDRYPHQLSGGQRQRVVIAAALVAEPELIVLDEPTTALDKTVESQVLDLVGRLQKRTNTTLIYVSHDLNVIARMCERVLVMKDGKVLEDGPTTEVFTNPRTDYARALIAAIPRLSTATRSNVKRLPSPSMLAARNLDFAYRTGSSWTPLGRLFPKRQQPNILSEISLAIPVNSTLGVVGESGSGKSTLAAIIAGLVDGNSGAIEFDGKPLSGLATQRNRDLRRRIQMIFQDPASSLNPQHTVEQIIVRPLQIFFGMTRAAARDRAAELLGELDLGPQFLGRSPRQLSGGQQQRVAIARAFAGKPDLVLCDEVTSALDVTVQASVLKAMKRLQREHGTAYLFISHDLPVVAEMSDQILVLEKGNIRDYGDTATVLSTPTSDYTKRLLAAFETASQQLANRTLKHAN